MNKVQTELHRLQRERHRTQGLVDEGSGFTVGYLNNFVDLEQI